MATDTKVSITINATDGNQKKTSTKIPYVNPQTSDTVLKEFAEMCADLSSDTYVGVTKTTETDISDGGSSKLVPTISWQNPSGGTIKFATLYQQLNSMKFTYCIFEIGRVTFEQGTTFAVKSTFPTIGGVAVINEDGYAQLQLGICAEELDSTPADGTITVYIPETDTTVATTAVMTVTVE